MKKIAILFTFILLFFSKEVGAETNAYSEHIQSFNVNVNVQSDGRIKVEEAIDYDFASYQKHGIYRDIPLFKTNTDGKKYILDISELSVTDEQGRGYPFKRTKNSNGDLSLRIGEPNRTITGLHRYTIRYIVSGALTYFSDHDELYWNVIGTQWSVPIETATAQITLPKRIEGSSLKLACYTGAQSSTTSNCTYQSTSDSSSTTRVSYTATGDLGSYEGMTVVVGFPKGIAATFEPRLYVPFQETWYGKFLIFLLTTLLSIASLLWYVVYPVWIVIKWFRHGRDPSGTQLGEVKGSVRAWFDPPKAGNRVLTPAETGSLVDEKVDIRDLVASIVDLARRGYMKIEERKKDDFYLRKKKDYVSDNDLQPFEYELLSAIFSSEDEVRLKDKYMSTTIVKVKDQIYKKLVTDGFFPKNPQSIRTFYTVITVLALMSFNLALFIVSLVFGRAMPIKSVKGVEASYIAKSLKNFLSSQERQLTFQANKQMMFEKLLPYAVAFGVEKIWAKRFEDIALKDPDWYSRYGTSRFNSYVFANSIHNSFASSVSRSVTPTNSSSGFSSGFSGGSSGGGGGGGGGGSW